MDWYYAVGEDRKGPHSATEFQELVQQGVVTPETLVWHLGMEDWQPYGKKSGIAGLPTATPPVAAAPPVMSAPPAGHLICAGCGGVFPESEVISLASRTYCSNCKPLAIQRLKEGVLPDSTSDAEEIRKKYLKHEASVKSVGFLYFLGGVGFFLVGAASIFALSMRPAARPAVTAAVFLGLGIVQFCTGFGLRKLKRWARIPSGILSGLGLMAIPIGTLINAYILYLIFSKKGRMVFSEEYQDIIKQTPHIKYRTSIVVWIVLAALLALLGIIALVAYFKPR